MLSLLVYISGMILFFYAAYEYEITNESNRACSWPRWKRWLLVISCICWPAIVIGFLTVIATVTLAMLIATACKCIRWLIAPPVEIYIKEIEE